MAPNIYTNSSFLQKRGEKIIRLAGTCLTHLPTLKRQHVNNSLWRAGGGGVLGESACLVGGPTTGTLPLTSGLSPW